MEDSDSVAMLMDCTTSKIQQLQKAFAELESHRAITLNMKWKELEEHFHGLERSLKRRFHELEDQEKEYETKSRKAREILEKREAEVMAKEHASLAKLQEKRDAAMFAISKATEKHRKIITLTVAEHVGVENCNKCESDNVVDSPVDALSPESPSEESKISFEPDALEAMTYPELVKMCEEMDSDGLHKFISDNRKNLSVLRDEIPTALKAAEDPAEFVLNSLKNFYPAELSISDGKKDSTLLGVRRTCIMLMECLSTLLVCSDVSIISPDIMKQAKIIADQWKPILETLDMDASNGNSLEAHAFLQLLATFGITSEFDEKIICGLVPMVSRRRQAAELCRYLGLSEKMPGVIEVLVNSGRHIDAVNLSLAFDLSEHFPPIPLLKAFLKEARKSALAGKPGSPPPAAQNEMINDRELSALKAVIRCIEEHKLEEQYPLEPLQKRLFQLEKAKETAKPQTKRPRANCPPRADKNFYPRVPERYSQYGYDRQPYVYQVPPATYNFGPNVGNYFGNGYHYPAPYLHQ